MYTVRQFTDFLKSATAATNGGAISVWSCKKNWELNAYLVFKPLLMRHKT